ncbi:MAG TPA: MBL fold metallo-hydrolase [Rubrobacteraceae bacterium]|nr:MBL fold metallo-hydrolase [Rubrobacteraceae bacterium]
MEILPGIHRIESNLGPRFMCQYLLVGEERTVLVDSGLAETPEEVIVPYLDGIGLGIESVDEVVISHADVDHCGGNSALKEMNPSLRFSCGEPDRPYVESTQVMLAEIYRWSEPYGFGPDEESVSWILESLGGDCPIDEGLRGGETLRLGPDWRIEIMHLPGHTPGHLGIWDPKHGAAIIIDAALESGIYDREGNRLIPPRYFDAAGYRSTIRNLRTLRPEHLLTAHYPLLQGQDALDFLDRSLDFTEQVHRVVSEAISAGITDLWELTKRADERLGPYPESREELGAGVRAHLTLQGPA